MVSSSNRPEQSFASQVASELNQPTRGKGVDRLAADLGASVVSKHPAETPMRMALLNLQAKTRAKSVKIEVELRADGSVKWWASAWYCSASLAGQFGDTLKEAIVACEAEVASESKRLERAAMVWERVEREVAEIEAAEAALKATAPLEFRPDGSPVDILPVEPFDGVTPADGGGA